MKKKKKFPVLIVIIVLAVAAYTGYQFLYGGLVVETVECQVGTVEDYYSTTGRIVSGDSLNVVSEASGSVLKINVKENDSVSKGDVIAVIDNIDINNELKLAHLHVEQAESYSTINLLSSEANVSPEDAVLALKSAVNSAKAVYNAAEIAFKADEKLYQSKSISTLKYNTSKAEFDKASSALEEANSNYQAAQNLLNSIRSTDLKGKNLSKVFYDSLVSYNKSAVESAKIEENTVLEKLDKCTIRATESGIITELPVKSNNVISAGSVIAVIRPAGKAYAETDLLTTAVPYINIGDPVEVKISIKGGNEIYSGSVSEIYDFASEGTSAIGLKEYRVHVKIRLDGNSKLEDRNGYGAKVKFKIFSDGNCLCIPASAVFSEGDQDFVYTVSADDRTAVAVPVSSIYKNAEKYVVGDGLSSGDVIISNCKVDGLSDGVKLAK